MDCEGKSDTSPEREPADDDPKGVEGTEGVKKRKRKPYRPGKVHVPDVSTFIRLKCIDNTY